MKLAFSIAKRFLTYSKGQSILIILGIAIGVSVQIFIGLLITGLQDDLINTTVGSSPHITIIASEEDVFEYTSSLKNEVNNIEQATAVGVFADNPAFLVSDEKSSSVLIRGYQQDAPKIYKLDERLVEGQLPQQRNEIVLGITLAQEYNIHVNEVISIQTVTNKVEEFVVVGIFNLGITSLNDSWMFTTLASSQALFDLNDSITTIEIQIEDVFVADEIANELNTSNDVFVENWKDKNADLLSGLNGQSVSSIMIQVFVLIAVILGIASVLAITVLQKSRQIGILKAMGIQNTQASFIFLFQGLMLGLIGAVVGVILGIGLIVMFTTFATNPDGSALIAIQYDVGFIVFSASIAIVSALLASLIPARKSSKLSPIEVIRNG